MRVHVFVAVFHFLLNAHYPRQPLSGGVRFFLFGKVRNPILSGRFQLWHQFQNLSLTGQAVRMLRIQSYALQLAPDPQSHQVVAHKLWDRQVPGGNQKMIHACGQLRIPQKNWSSNGIIGWPPPPCRAPPPNPQGRRLPDKMKVRIWGRLGGGQSARSLIFIMLVPPGWNWRTRSWMRPSLRPMAGRTMCPMRRFWKGCWH
jgi:hypothetical protein